MRTIRHASLLAALALGTAASPAHADRTEALLSILRAKGIITEQEYQSLLAEADAELARQRAAQATAAAAAPATAAADDRLVRRTDSGVGLQIGDVTLKVSGSVNGFYVHDNPDSPGPRTTVVGGLAAVGDNTSAVRNGLLPGFLKFDVTTTQGGWDIGAHIGFYPGINSVDYVGGANSAGNPAALGTAGIDARQTYLTVARKDVGEFKIGRDIGLFANEAILNDMTLLGVGTPAGNAAPSNTTLGRIGLGYLYTDFQPQITYTTPKLGGFQASAGIFQPLRTAGRPGEVNDTPGFQAKVSYDFGAADSLSGRVWASGIIQKHDASAPGRNDDYTGSGFDVGARLGFAGASLLGYYYSGSGLGTTGLFIFAVDPRGEKRDSSGFYVQGTYSLGKALLGVSYGRSSLDLADREVNPTLVRRNSSIVGQGRYSLTSWVTLVGEYIHTKAKAHGGNEASSDALALGAILFF